MRLIPDCKAAERRVLFVRRGIVWLAMLSLIVTLAGRTVHLPRANTTSVQSNLPDAKIQHRNKDAVRWSAPVASVLLFWSPISSPRIIAQDEPLPAAMVDFGLYTRPPPAR